MIEDGKGGHRGGASIYVTVGQLVEDEVLERVRDAAAATHPDEFGFALASVDGDVDGIGEWRRCFPIQSISKVFALTLVVAQSGQAIWRRVGREPSGHRFSSLIQVEYEQGIPRNPFINAGALVLVDELLDLTGDAYSAVVKLLRRRRRDRRARGSPSRPAPLTALSRRSPPSRRRCRPPRRV